MTTPWFREYRYRDNIIKLIRRILLALFEKMGADTAAKRINSFGANLSSVREAILFVFEDVDLAALLCSNAVKMSARHKSILPAGPRCCCYLHYVQSVWIQNLVACYPNRVLLYRNIVCAQRSVTPIHAIPSFHRIAVVDDNAAKEMRWTDMIPLNVFWVSMMQSSSNYHSNEHYIYYRKSFITQPLQHAIFLKDVVR